MKRQIDKIWVRLVLIAGMFMSLPQWVEANDNNPCFGTGTLGVNPVSITVTPDSSGNVSVPGVSLYTPTCDNGGAWTYTAIPASSMTVYNLPHTGTITASDCCNNEHEVSYTISFVCGCNGCSLGQGSVSVGSVNVRIGLGKNFAGEPAGELFLVSDLPTSDMSSPRGLGYFDYGNVTQIRGADGALRQVISAECLADITSTNEFYYEINMFYPSNLASMTTSGVYAIAGNPFQKWTFRNPANTTNDLSHFLVQSVDCAVVPAITNMYEYLFDTSNRQWRLESGGGTKIETKTSSWNTNLTIRTETNLVMDAGSNVLYKSISIYGLYPWGQAVDQVTVDPDGVDPRVTEYSYYSDTNDPGRLSQLKSVKSADGSWVRYDYDGNARRTQTVKPWKDSDILVSNEFADATYVSYAPVDTLDSADTNDNWKSYLPRTTTRKVLNTVVSLSYNAYYQEPDTGLRVHIEEIAGATNAAYGSSNNLRTVKKFFHENTNSPAANDIACVQYPDGQFETNTYDYGSLNTNVEPHVFVANGTGTFIRVITLHTVIGNPQGIANRSTKEVVVMDAQRRTVYQETYVYSGSAYERTSWTVTDMNAKGQILQIRKSNGTWVDTTWNCCGKDTETDETGARTQYFYDALKRMITKVATGVDAGEYPAQSDVVTDYGIDVGGKTIAVTNTGAGLVLVSSNFYDLGGMQTSKIDQAGLTTVMAHALGGRVLLNMLPSGGSQVISNYLDGSLRSVTGSGQTEQYTMKGVNSDGTLWTQVYSGEGGSNSLSWVKSTTDILGRTIKEEKSSFRGSVISTINVFNNIGQRVKVINTGMPDMLFEYDAFGQVVRSGYDVDNNHTLDVASMDRITDNTNYLEKVGSDWWNTATTKIYPLNNASTALTTGIQRLRLSGLGTNVAEQTVSVDVFGVATTNQTAVDRANRKVTRLTIVPDSTNRQEQVSVNGLAVASIDKTMRRIAYLYDGLRRQTNMIDPRTGAMQTHYNNKGQVDFTVDAAGFTNFMAYDSAGRQAAVTNALGKVKRMDHDQRNNVITNSGDTEYPIIYTFDSFGRMATMKTFRGATNGTADTTTWRYDEASGLLTNKVYNDGTLTAYTYNPQGTLATRTWARNITTTYSYDLLNQLLNVDYSDTTPDVTNAYDRVGRMTNVVDGQGNHSYVYSLQGLETSETCPEGTLTRSYDLLGRSTGFGVAGDYALVYGYDQVGRFGSITSTILGSTRAFGYEYLADSDLLAGMTNDVSKWEKRYEPNRNLLTGVTNKVGVGNAIVSRFTYGNDPLGRRTNRIDSGDSYQPATTNLFEYNNRSEVVSATMSQNHAFGYDNIGNRISATNGGAAYSYVVNGLNQYTNSTISGTPYELGYDPDGNMLTNRGVKYTWNGENQLIIAESPSPANGHRKVESSYDSRGRRWKKVVWMYTNSDYTVLTTNLFLYDGWNLVRETRQGVSSTVVTTNHHIWGLDLSGSLQGAGGIGGLLQKTSVSNGTVLVALYYSDGNGNIVSAVDEAGTTVATWKWDPYGKFVTGSGTLVAAGDPWRFSSKYFDAETALYYYGYRFYDPEAGRWVSRDPMGEREEGSLYTYVKNSPSMNIDAKGLVSTTLPGGGVTYTESGTCGSHCPAGGPMYYRKDDLEIPYAKGAVITVGGWAGYTAGGTGPLGNTEIDSWAVGASQRSCGGGLYCVKATLYVHLTTWYTQNETVLNPDPADPKNYITYSVLNWERTHKALIDPNVSALKSAMEALVGQCVCPAKASCRQTEIDLASAYYLAKANYEIMVNDHYQQLAIGIPLSTVTANETALFSAESLASTAYSRKSAECNR